MFNKRRILGYIPLFVARILVVWMGEENYCFLPVD